jgi:hypothetical protein
MKKGGRNQQQSKTVSVPVAKTKVTRQGGPRVRSSNGTVKIQHREYIGDLYGSPVFEVDKFAINPGLKQTFPWLSFMGNLYESYSVDKMNIIFETEAPTSAPGTVILAVDYDASDEAPKSKLQVMNYRHTVKGPTWSEQLVFKAAPQDLKKRKQFLTRSGNLPSGSSLPIYDVCNLFVCKSGQDSSNLIGGISIDYDITLYTPQIGDPNLMNVSWGLFKGTSNSAPASSYEGTLAVSAASFGSTPSSTTAFTFNQSFKGLLGVDLEGTDLGSTTVTGVSTLNILGYANNSAGTVAVGNWYIEANEGDDLSVQIANTTITSSSFRFSPFGSNED